MRKRLNLTAMHPTKVWAVIYPLYARQFLFGRDYDTFAQMVAQECILTPNQWDAILAEWEFKEYFLTLSEPTPTVPTVTVGIQESRHSSTVKGTVKLTFEELVKLCPPRYARYILQAHQDDTLLSLYFTKKGKLKAEIK